MHYVVAWSIGIWLADECGHGDLVHGLHFVFYFNGEHFKAADDEHVFGAVAQVDIPFFIHIAYIAGVHPGFVPPLTQ